MLLLLRVLVVVLLLLVLLLLQVLLQVLLEVLALVIVLVLLLPLVLVQSPALVLAALVPYPPLLPLPPPLYPLPLRAYPPASLLWFYPWTWISQGGEGKEEKGMQ